MNGEIARVKEIFRKNKFLFLELMFAGIGALIAVLACLPNSRDGESYQYAFDHLNDTRVFSYFLGKDYIFWGWLAWVKSINGTLAIGLFPLILSALIIKLNVIRTFSASSIYGATCYFSLFFMLHEGTQLRIAIALSFALLACKEIWDKRYVRVLPLCGLAFGFHVSALLLPLLFFLSVRYSLVGKAAWPFLASGILLDLTHLAIFQDVIYFLLYSMGEHYEDYIYFSVYTKQNNSGFFYVYAYFLIPILLLLEYWRRAYPERVVPILNNCLVCSIYGCALLFWFSGTIAVASRISDVLTISVVPVVACAINTSGKMVRYVSFLGLSIVFVIRAGYLFGR